MLSPSHSYYMIKWDNTSSSVPLRCSVSNSPLKSEINPTTLNLRVKQWRVSSDSVTMILSEIQIHFFKKGGGKEKDNLCALCLKFFADFPWSLLGFPQVFSLPGWSLFFCFCIYLLLSFPYTYIHTRTNSTEICERSWIRWKVRTGATYTERPIQTITS